MDFCMLLIASLWSAVCISKFVTLISDKAYRCAVSSNPMLYLDKI